MADNARSGMRAGGNQTLVAEGEQHMTSIPNKYKLLLIQPFQLPQSSRYGLRPTHGTKEATMVNYNNIKHLLEDVEWDLHPGAIAPYGDWPVETREEFCLVAAGRLPIVREACASGKYNAIVLLGGGEPGFPESREIARPYGIPVTSCAFSQMHFAAILAAAVCAAAPQGVGMGNPGAGRLQLRDNPGESHDRPGRRRQRSHVSGRPAAEMAAQEGVLRCAAFIKAQNEFWAKLVKQVGVTAEQ